MQRHYLNVAHRGASAHAPENTLLAFERAIELGADMSELDLHLSRDGALVVMHDASVDHTTDGHGAIRDLSLAELKRLDAGQGQRVPTLPEVIDLVRGRSGLYLELKAQGTPRAAADCLRAKAPANGFTGRQQVIVGSFDAALAREAKALAPEIATSLLVGPVYPAQTLIDLARSAHADYLHLCWENRAPHPHELLTPDLLRALRAAGLGIVLWHEERDDELRVLRTLDVDAICTNTPEKL
ncbi:MAG: glycerophosphodiester phosphodiesterase [Chloroflexi bacterium]|nr:MAG: glycerophosphodiester phosphodiesterase [Chloroflexota bacterium]